MAATVSALHHVTIGCAPADLPGLLAFYTGVVGLTEGYRPDLRHPGHWLYANGHAVLHLNALLPATPPVRGPVDHVALQAQGLHSTKAWLQEAGITFSEQPLKGTSLYQVFIQDPLGLTVELNFDLAAE